MWRLCFIALSAAIAFQPAAAGRAPRNAAEFDALFEQVSNWGRWGKDDQLGAVNLVTAAKRKQAVALVKSGVNVSLAHMGINLLDNQDLEALSETAARLNRWEFMITIAPVPV